jgi:hypothetical protein
MFELNIELLREPLMLSPLCSLAVLGKRLVHLCRLLLLFVVHAWTVCLCRILLIEQFASTDLKVETTVYKKHM